MLGPRDGRITERLPSVSRDVAPLALAAGDRLADRYELVEQIGRGGQGVVWSARDRIGGERVAVKVLADAQQGPSSVRVRREVAAMRLLDLPGVARLLDEGTSGNNVFIVMELVNGAPFPGRGRAPHRWNDISAPTTNLVETLARIHAMGVVHRDLKPSNILVADDGRCTLVDFGVSKIASVFSDNVTAPGGWVGTAAYVAPEVLTGNEATARSDIYAIGVMLYEALCGFSPHPTGSEPGLLQARLARRPTPLSDVAPDVPRAIAQLIMRMLAPDADERPGSALEVLAQLAGHGVEGTRVLPWLGPRSPIEHVVRVARAGRCIDIAGAPGSGRTRCLREVAAALSLEGERVLETVVDSRAFGSLAPVIAAPRVPRTLANPKRCSPREHAR